MRGLLCGIDSEVCLEGKLTSRGKTHEALRDRISLLQSEVTGLASALWKE